MTSRGQLEVWLLVEHGQGWGPVTQLARLAAELGGGSLNRLQLGARPISRPALLARIGAAVTSRVLPRSSTGPLLVIAPNPASLNEFVATRPPSRQPLFAWVIDSFWTDNIPASVRAGAFKHIFITDRDDVALWRTRARCDVSVLPWGTDALRSARHRVTKTVDLQRVGRQPAAWDSDERVADMAADAGLTYRGRPPFGSSDEESMEHLHRALARARAVLAFANRAAPAHYTHPTKEYLTARWTDALGHGCLVMGSSPRSGTAGDLLPSFALHQLDPSDPVAGLREVRALLATSDVGRENRIRTHALNTLDWRHRLKSAYEAMDIHSEKLESEIAELDELRRRLAVEA